MLRRWITDGLEKDTVRVFYNITRKEVIGHLTILQR